MSYIKHIVSNIQSTGMENLYGNNKLRLKYVKYSAMIHRAKHVDKLCFRGKLWFLTGCVTTVNMCEKIIVSGFPNWIYLDEENFQK